MVEKDIGELRGVERETLRGHLRKRLRSAKVMAYQL